MTSAANGPTSGPNRAKEGVDLVPIEQLRAHEYVAEQLRRQIGLHIVPVGSALPTERELAIRFGVGRATVQAAVRLLEAERLVASRRGRRGGTFVVGQGEDGEAKDYLLLRLRRNRGEIVEAMAFRREVDRFAAALAAKNRMPEELAQIQAANDRALAAESDVGFMSGDTEFHLAIARAAHNRHVYDAVERMRLILNDALTALPESEMWKRKTATEHAAILGAIRQGRSTEAGKAMERHVASTEKSIGAMLAAL